MKIINFLFIIIYFAFFFSDLRSQSTYWEGSDSAQTTDSGFIKIGDFNNDGVSDIIKYLDGNFFVGLGSPDSKGFPKEDLWANSDVLNTQNGSYFVGDFNGDGYCDIATSIYDKD